ncbi:hypothetical protein LPB19_12765 [Marinobacter salinisoli]|uniref:Tetratricopeptide repeat protein n=1 Tax=Marinobacter salinisoli TaxID=2769486 RepID=A0ABX7MP46_9GAMM|nr:hypothetical protein [Marinobacter salinisoli]QSP94060.1 hypothetical protein LPB19_12765 [Marinobacter salinisoli]
MRYLIALVLSTLLIGTASAGQCPALVSEIDQKLETAQLDPETEQNVKSLRDEGERLHEQGDHSESVRTLKEALEMIRVAS